MNTPMQHKNKKKMACSTSRWLLLLYIAFSGLLHIHAQDMDSIVNTATQYAANNDIKALKDTYKQYGDQLPGYVRLYCEMAIAHHEERYEKMIQCIDTLRIWYPKQVSSKTNLSLAEYKAEGLRRMGKYEELHDFCDKEIKTFQRKRFKKSSLNVLRNYLDKGRKLSGNSPRAQLLQCVDLDDIHRLDSIYPLVKDQVREFERTLSEYTLAYAFHRHEQQYQCSQTLLEQFTDSMDDETFTNCVLQQCQTLTNHCQWNELEQWIKKVKASGRAHSGTLTPYEHFIRDISRFPQPELIMPDSVCTLATTYEWPLLLPVQINGNTPIPFSISTEQPYTLISEKEANKLHIEPLCDTLQITFEGNLIHVSPAIVDDLQMGSIHFKHLFVLVVHEKDNALTFFDNTLGLHELISLGKIEFMPEKLHIYPNHVKTSAKAQRRNMFLNPQGALRLISVHNGKTHPLRLTSNSPRNIIANNCFPNFKEGDETIRLNLLNQDVEMRHPLTAEDRVNCHCAILGMPFFRNYASVTLDFSNMTISAKHLVPYNPTRLNFSHTTDKLYLRRNATALQAGQLLDPSESLFLDMLISIGKNRPQKVAEICEQLRHCKSDFYDVYTETEALFLCGSYMQAYQIGKTYIDKGPSSDPDDQKEYLALQDLAHICQLYRNTPAILITGQTASLSTNSKTETEIRINGKKVQACFDLFTPFTCLSHKVAKKLKVETLGTHKGKIYGVIPEMDCNGIILRNLPCFVLNKNQSRSQHLPAKGKGIIIGWNTLRYLKNYTMTANSITLSAVEKKFQSKGSPICHDHIWKVETESAGTFPTYELTHNASHQEYGQILWIDGHQINVETNPTITIVHPDQSKNINTINFPQLLKTCGKLTFNFKDMRLHIEK